MTGEDNTYIGIRDQDYTLGKVTSSGNYTTQIWQNLIIGQSSNICTSTFNGVVYLKDAVNPDTPLNIGNFNQVSEASANPLNVYKVTNFYNEVILNNTLTAGGGFYGSLHPPNSGGTIYGELGLIMNYDASGASDSQHQFKINGGQIMNINGTNIITNKPLNANEGFSSNGGIRCNSTGNKQYYVGGINNFDLLAITEPKLRKEIASGTGDGATSVVFNNAINSLYSTGFVDTCYKSCRAIIDHRNGNFITNGIISAGGTVYTPTVMGTNGLEHDTTTSTGIHNFKVAGTQKVYFNNTDLTNTVYLTQFGVSTFSALINADAGITLGGTNTDPVNIIKILTVNLFCILVMMVVVLQFLYQ
jgi:Phage T4 tail fibre